MLLEGRVVAVSIRVVKLFFSSNKILALNDRLFIPTIGRNLISVLGLFKQGYFILFNNEISIKLNGSFICLGKLVDDLYLITPKIYEIHDIELNNKSHNLPLK